METTEQARGTIWRAIADWRGPKRPVAQGIAREVKGLAAFSRAADVSASMIYQFARRDGPVLGRVTVNKMAPLLPSVPRETWLAAMGVEPTAGIEANP